MSISIVVPICNEVDNIPLLYQQLVAVLPSLAQGQKRWSASLTAEPIVRLILDGSVVRVRLDRKACGPIGLAVYPAGIRSPRSGPPRNLFR